MPTPAIAVERPDGSRGAAQILVERTQAILAVHARTARSLPERMVGLLDRSSLAPGEALVIMGCKAIHTCFMRFPIDAVFVDPGWRVVAVHSALAPWRFSPVVWGAQAVIELPVGTAGAARIAPGDQLVLQPVAEKRA